MQLISVVELYESCADSLTLHWVAGRAGSKRNILLRVDEKLAHVGYLNLIHPHQIQVISLYELAYLDALTRPVYQETLKQLFENDNLASVIVVDSHATDDLKEYSEKFQVPLFVSQLPGEHVINYLHTTFAGLLAQRTTLHGVFMDVLGMGVLIMGRSGTGKSELALELVSRGHRLIADDAPEFCRVSPNVINGACAMSGMNPFLEVRGLGILNVQALFGNSSIKTENQLRLIVMLEQMSEERLKSIDRLQGDYRVRRVLGVDIPEISLPVAAGRNLAVLLESAVRNHSLKEQGYNAADDFCERQQQAMQDNSSRFNTF
jgi:HPr kinase/phosphorylase